MGGEEYLPFINIVPDQKSHILVADNGRCLRCELRPCLKVCPSGVFNWDETACSLDVLWRRCLECGACEPACPQGNIQFQFPRGGFGVTYYM